MGIWEEVFYEGGFYIGDLIFNLLIGLIIIGFFLMVAVVVWVLWLRYWIINCWVLVIGGWMG